MGQEKTIEEIFWSVSIDKIPLTGSSKCRRFVGCRPSLSVFASDISHCVDKAKGEITACCCWATLVKQDKWLHGTAKKCEFLRPRETNETRTYTHHLFLCFSLFFKHVKNSVGTKQRRLDKLRKKIPPGHICQPETNSIEYLRYFSYSLTFHIFWNKSF